MLQLLMLFIGHVGCATWFNSTKTTFTIDIFNDIACNKSQGGAAGPRTLFFSASSTPRYEDSGLVSLSQDAGKCKAYQSITWVLPLERRGQEIQYNASLELWKNESKQNQTAFKDYCSACLPNAVVNGLVDCRAGTINGIRATQLCASNKTACDSCAVYSYRSWAESRGRQLPPYRQLVERMFAVMGQCSGDDLVPSFTMYAGSGCDRFISNQYVMEVAWADSTLVNGEPKTVDTDDGNSTTTVETTATTGCLSSATIAGTWSDDYKLFLSSLQSPDYKGSLLSFKGQCKKVATSKTPKSP